jgi:ribosomal-protein-alanine N-acetyltransferase
VSTRKERIARDYPAMARVVLSTPTLADEADFLAANLASRAYHRPYAYNPLTPADYRTYLFSLGERKLGYFARTVADGTLVGWLNLSEIIRGNFQSAFCGYCGYAASAGQGYMTEALGLLVREAFVMEKLHRIEANIQPANAPSIALAKRVGFEFEGASPRYLKIGGRWRDHERYALLAEAWRGRHQ